ncbi:MAG: hypothetical protein PHE67_03990 [Campylobacterales bacterium]|nr:hypothetical protein [Campylobacterales bacterium]
MRKALLVSLSLASILLADGKSLREHMIDKKLEFIPLGKTNTLEFGVGHGNTYKYAQACKDMGGNLYVKIGEPGFEQEFAYYDDKGNVLNPTDNFLSKALGNTKEPTNFDAKDKNPWVCKKGNDTKFRLTKKLFKRYSANGLTDVSHAYVLEHKPESIELKSHRYAEIDNKYANGNYSSFVDSFPGHLKNEVGGGIYQIKMSTEERYSSLEPDTIFGRMFDMWRYCEVNKGAFYKDGRGFSEVLKDYYEKEIPSQDRKTKTSAYTGIYGCMAPEAVAFTAKLEYGGPTEWGAGFRGSIKPGFDKAMMASAPNLKNKAATNTQSTDIFSKVALKTAEFMGPFAMQEGNLNLFGSYNGKNSDGCSLVSVTKRVEGFGKGDTLNYKVCSGEVTAIGESAPTNLPSNIKQSMQLVGMASLKYGKYSVVSGGYTINGIKLNKCDAEVTVFDSSDRAIEKQVVSGCKR